MSCRKMSLVPLVVKAVAQLENLGKLFGISCDLTYELNILFPGEGVHFTGPSPKKIDVRLEVWAGSSFNQQRTSGTLSINGVQVRTWNERKSTSHPFRLDFTVSIKSGENVILVASNNGKVQETRTVYLDS